MDSLLVAACTVSVGPDSKEFWATCARNLISGQGFCVQVTHNSHPFRVNYTQNRNVLCALGPPLRRVYGSNLESVGSVIVKWGQRGARERKEEVDKVARPAQNTRDGDWSLTQIAKHAGMKKHTIRALADGGWLPTEGLKREHILIARVAATLLDAPLPDGEGKRSMSAATVDRYRSLLAKAWDAIADTDTAQSVALISPTDATVVASMSRATVFIEDQTPPAAVLVIPIGAWAQEVRDA